MGCDGIVNPAGDIAVGPRNFRAKMLIKKLEYTPPAPDRERTERDCAALTEQLGQQQLEALLAEGAAMTLDQAVAFALAANP